MAGLLPEASAAELKPIQAGFSERDISPSIGMEEPGGYGKSFHTKFHDPCKVRVAVFDDGQRRVALVGVDALIVPRPLVEAAREEIRQACGLEPSAVLIGASHSHSSGPIGMVQPGEFDFASPLVQRLAYEESSGANATYLELVRKRIVEAVVEANAARANVECGFGRGTEDKVSFNRRLRMKSGQTWSHPGQGNPDIAGYAGPIDPEVGVVGAWDKQGKLVGCIVNFACHATTNPGGISSNWIYYLEKTIRGALDAPVPIIFLQGACGDITQVDNLSPYQNPPPEDWARRVGGRVGAEAVRVLLAIPKTNYVRLDSVSQVTSIKRRIPRPERVLEAMRIVERNRTNVAATVWTFAKETLLLDALIKRAPTVPVEVQAIQIGPLVLISNPAEYFVEFGLRMKKGSGFPFTFPVELANGCVGYVPTLEAFESSGGGYETRLTSYSNLDINAGEEILSLGLTLARGMKSDPPPEFPTASPFRQPWSYGNVPPERD